MAKGAGLSMQILALVIVVMMLFSAVAIFVLRDLMASVVAFSVVSLGLSVSFVLLRAPDVAMTEAAVGAGLSSLLFALALRTINQRQGED
jgi:uncharacterized MnhB-related membrane protein